MKKVGGYSGLTPGQVVYLDKNGCVTRKSPSTAADALAWPIGIAISETEIQLAGVMEDVKDKLTDCSSVEGFMGLEEQLDIRKKWKETQQQKGVFVDRKEIEASEERLKDKLTDFDFIKELKAL